MTYVRRGNNLVTTIPPFAAFWQGVLTAFAVQILFNAAPPLLRVVIYFPFIFAVNRKEDQKLKRALVAFAFFMISIFLGRLLGGIPFLGDAINAIPDYWVLAIPAAYHLFPSLKELDVPKEGYSLTPMQWFCKAALVCAGFTLLGLILLNVDPWITVSQGMFAGINLGFLNWVASLPIVGTWLRNFAGNSLGVLFGVFFWGLCQTIQVIPLILESHPTLIDKLTNANKGIRELTLKFQFARGISYMVEFIIVTVARPFYEGGWGQIWMDTTAGWNLDAEKLNWWNALASIITIGAVEYLIMAAIMIFHMYEWAMSQTSKKSPMHDFE